MDMNQMQAEIMRIQSEYMADPTPENLVKMQQEMAAITEQATAMAMGNLSAQMSEYDPSGRTPENAAMTAGAQANYNMYAQAMAGMFGGDDEQEMKDFVAAHPAPADKAKYLPIGALLLCTNNEPYETFAIMQDDWLEAMEEGWGMKTAKAGAEMLASLLEGRHEAAYGDDYRKLKAGQNNDFDEDSVEGYRETLQNLQEDLPALLPFAQKCDTLLAWDLERCGYLARIFVKLGWLDESEMFGWLEKTAAKIKTAFPGWGEYAASIMMGRAVAMGFDFSVVGAACELFGEKKEFLESHPIINL